VLYSSFCCLSLVVSCLGPEDFQMFLSKTLGLADGLDPFIFSSKTLICFILKEMRTELGSAPC
jgi:hypothetical protein